MTTLRRASAALVLALVALLASCTELDGQRISIRYDAAADVLHVLLHYDGIHEKNGDSPAAREQVPAFLAGGDVLLLDWFGHVEMKEIREEAEKEGTPPAMKAFLHALAGSVKARAVGHYRDPRGRIGAVQHVEVRDASVLVRKANAALNEGILSGHADPEWRRTAARMEAGAREGRQWIFLDGHAVGITFAADPAEWALIRRKAVRDIAREFAEERRKEEGDPGPDGLEEAPPGETPEAAALRIAAAEGREAAAREATPRERGLGRPFQGHPPRAPPGRGGRAAAGGRPGGGGRPGRPPPGTGASASRSSASPPWPSWRPPSPSPSASGTRAAPPPCASPSGTWRTIPSTRSS